MDRNIVEIHPDGRVTWSLSARRAWIEIDWARSLFRYLGVALRKESVDRNINSSQLSLDKAKSLSARRAWIEIAQGR